MKWRFNLFWKFFLWLWLTLLLFAAVHFILLSYVHDEIIHIEPATDAEQRMLQRFSGHLETPRLPDPRGEQQPLPHPELVLRYERNSKTTGESSGRFNLFIHRKQHDKTQDLLPRPRFIFRDEPGGKAQRFLSRTNLFLLNQQGNEIHGKPLDQTLTLLHSQYLSNRKPHVAYKRQDLYMGPAIVKQDGETRYAYWHRTLHSLGEEHLKLLWAQAPKSLFLSAVLITFPVCFALAWYMSGPIRGLQRATHEFSSTREVPTQIKPLLNRNDEFGDLARDFNRMAAQIQTMLESQKRLLSDVSHELRSPLARLRIALGLAERKAESRPGAADRKPLDQMILECGRLDSLIGQLLDIARLDGGVSANAKTVDFDMSELILNIVKDAEMEASQKQLTLQDSLPNRQPMKGAPEMLRSAVENVLRNAIRHAPMESEIQIRLSAEDSQVLLTISDSGPGVEEAHLDKIFEPFYRPQYARDRSSGGSGLGLAIARRAIEHHAGHIWAENAPGGGLQVSIQLPRGTEKGSRITN